VLGRARPLTDEQVRLAQLEAVVDQVRATIRGAATANAGNRPLVDLALDVENLLAGR